MHRLAVRTNKVLIGIHMQNYGYSAEQRKRLISKLGDGKIWNIIKTYGPILLSIFIKYILPLLLAAEEPKEKAANFYLESDEEQFFAQEIPGSDDKDETDLE